MIDIQKRPILFLDHAPALGGAEHNLLLLLDHLDRERWSPHLGCVSGRLSQRAMDHNIPTHLLDLPRLRHSTHLPLDWLSVGRAIARLAQRINARLLIANTVRTAVYCALASRLISLPFIWYMQDFWLSETRPHFKLFDSMGKEILYHATSQVITNSAATASHLPNSRKIHVVHYGIDISEYNPIQDSIPFQQKHDLPTNTQIVGMMGRLRPWKGHQRFLQMASQVLASLPKTHFLIVGGDPFQVDAGYKENLQNLAKELGIRSRVTFTGHLEDVRPALASMQVFVHPGDPEPFGLVNLEAMASGKPVIAFAHGALPEIVVPNETGVLVPAGNIDALSRAVVDLLQDPVRCAEMGQHGRQRVRTKFTLHETISKIDHLFTQLLQ